MDRTNIMDGQNGRNGWTEQTEWMEKTDRMDGQNGPNGWNGRIRRKCNILIISTLRLLFVSPLFKAQPKLTFPEDI